MQAVTRIFEQSAGATKAAKAAGGDPDNVDLANKAATAENEAVKAFSEAIKVLEVQGLEIDTTEIAPVGN
ncbi:hypothetical protein NONI108955_44720 [Nocardia ninae]|uniref:Uncharacterized protein n=1 Tax=Nocardia ninae NBRC 108245 TaxID=1210091 RepID=A0A511M4Q8_9NOCA|nr:hypothetical protein NN4_01510 [Nocardia ninae NBRC 108245]